MAEDPSAVLEPDDSPKRKGAAWSVHLLTATGAVAGLMAMLAIVHENFSAAFAWMGVSIVIDSVDGFLARACKVKQVLPQFDGALLDNIVDYFTYVIVPAFFLCMVDVGPAHFGPLLAVLMTLTSGFQFCQTDAKTPDHCFKGFPSYWNLVVFYLFLLDWNPWVNAAVIVTFAVLIFVPIKYLYPTRTRVLRPVTLGLGLVWGALIIAVLILYPERNYLPWLYLSLAYVIYYQAASLYFTFRGYPG
ncbi:MAG TPA: CDP-alcohol phosphatidyltransferase family protein [Candidatus Hydrogenedentes bacterium]|nr:CDP-alcohol phosphatidyltransferase family protein [Candidatus Hydrogenedentota bacterium]